MGPVGVLLSSGLVLVRLKVELQHGIRVSRLLDCLQLLPLPARGRHPAMPSAIADGLLPERSSTWKWLICGLLFLATMINYMDRVTLNQMSKIIKDELHLSAEQYGYIEAAFGIAFALGAILVGLTVDHWNVRWVYPGVLLGWSAAGFMTGYAQGFLDLLLWRFLLGLFGAGNWPCALRATQRILPPQERTLGNSFLQSGAPIGAIITPLVVLALVAGEGTWRGPFFLLGAAGSLWVLLWLPAVRREDLAVPLRESSTQGPARSAQVPGYQSSIFEIYRDRRFWVLVTVVVMINLTWHFFRVWLPLSLRDSHGYSQRQVDYFATAYYAAAFAGSLTAGWASLFLVRHGLAVHWSRVLVFLSCALLTLLSLVTALLPAGPLLLGVLLVIAFGSLGLYPPYYSFSQELTIRHQGKVNGSLACLTWLATAVMHPLVGRWIDQTRDYASVMALAGLAPLVGVGALLFFWGKAQQPLAMPADLLKREPILPDHLGAQPVAGKLPS